MTRIDQILDELSSEIRVSLQMQRANATAYRDNDTSGAPHSPH